MSAYPSPAQKIGVEYMVTKIKPEELTKSVGSSAEVKRHLEHQREGIEYLQNNYSELLGKYHNKWIVIEGNELIAVEDTPKQLMKHLDELKEKDVLLYYLADPEDLLIL